MASVDFEGTVVECPEGANLRVVLLRARLRLYRSVSAAMNCRGRGVCGTCAVSIEGEVSEPTDAEAKRLGRFPHKAEDGLRLACQVNVRGDLKVRRYPGIWGARG